jgi:hypothetical protein
MLAGERAVGDDTERPHVRPLVDPALAARLLGAHVVRRSHDDAVGREACARHERLEPLRDAEVEHLDDLLVMDAADEYVGRLQIAVDDALLMGEAERLRDRIDDAAHFDKGQGADASAPNAQILALEQLHDQEGALVVDAVVVDLDHVRAPEARQSHRLELEARKLLAPAAIPARHDLQPHAAAEPEVVRDPHAAHPAARKAPHQAIARRDDLACGIHRWGILVS